MSDVTQLLDQLAETPAPEPPPTLLREVHLRVNRVLIIQHLVDFALRMVPCVALEFARATGALAWFTFTGDYPRRAKDRDAD
jgi:hypothetical protein